MTRNDPWDTPEMRRFARRALDDLVPMIRESALTCSLVPEGETDIKFAVELGLSIMLDKPIIAVIAPGTKVPHRMLRVVDEIVEMDKDNVGVTAERLQEAMKRILDED